MAKRRRESDMAKLLKHYEEEHHKRLDDFYAKFEQ